MAHANRTVLFEDIERREGHRRCIRFRTWAYGSFGNSRRAIVSDISESGIMLEGFPNLSVGDEISIKLPGLGIRTAKVRWVRGDAAGLFYFNPLETSALDNASSKWARFCRPAERFPHQARKFPVFGRFVKLRTAGQKLGKQG